MQQSCIAAINPLQQVYRCNLWVLTHDTQYLFMSPATSCIHATYLTARSKLNPRDDHIALQSAPQVGLGRMRVSQGYFDPRRSVVSHCIVFPCAATLRYVSPCFVLFRAPTLRFAALRYPALCTHLRRPSAELCYTTSPCVTLRHFKLRCVTSRHVPLRSTALDIK